MSSAGAAKGVASREIIWRFTGSRLRPSDQLDRVRPRGADQRHRAELRVLGQRTRQLGVLSLCRAQDRSGGRVWLREHS